MKTLFLVRHAKSSWDQSEMKDIERPLESGGKRSAEKMVKHLRMNGISPDLILSSPALRTTQTAEIFARGLSYPVSEIQSNRSIYGAVKEELFTIILGLSNEHNSVMIVGHDPVLTNVSAYLTKRSFEKVPTSGVVAIDFNVSSWSLIAPHSGSLRFFIYPKIIT